MVGATLDWTKDLERWLRPFLDRLNHKTRRRMCPAYVSGLIGPGERKSIQPMAERLALGSYDRLHHFISSGVWDAAPIEAELLVQADKLVGGRDAVLVIDDTAMLKKGKHSVGVAPQYCSALGKIANCQTLVSLTLARREVPIMLALRLFLPERWTSDPSRLKRAGVPKAYRKPRTKSEVALEELDRIIAAGVRFGCVLTDAGYGQSAAFRQGLTVRELSWAVGIPRHLKVYPADVKMIRPTDSARTSPSADTTRPVAARRRRAGQGSMAQDQLAPWHQRKTQGALRRPARAGRRRADAADQGQRQAASAWRRSLACRRAARQRRKEILSR